MQQTETEHRDIIEIQDLFDVRIGHYPDKSARWLFKEKKNVRGLVEIVAQELVDYLDFDQLKELNRSYVDDRLREVISDMVFCVPFREASEVSELMIYILIEHQSTVDPMMGFRLLYYMCQIWDGQRRELEEAKLPKGEWRLRPILPIVYYTGEQRWQTPLSLTAVMDVPDVVSRFIPSFDTLFLGVKDADADDLTKTGHPFGWLLTVLKQEGADEASMREALQTALSNLDTLPPDQAVQQKNAILYLYSLVFFRRPEDEREELVQLLRTHTQDKEVENIIMTGAEALIQQGIEQGIEKGIEQGIEKGIEQGIEKGEIRAKQVAVLKLLRYQFTDVPESVINQVSEIEDLTLLDMLFEQILEANSLDDIEFRS